MLTKADDYPIHQLPTPVSEVGTERNFYDRYFFNGYSSDGEVFFATALCLYPNLNIMDGSFVLVVDGVQHNFRYSRILNQERLDTKVGSLEIKILEPLKTLQVLVDDKEKQIKAELKFECRFPAVEEPRMTIKNGPRVSMDSTRMTQHGRWSGKIEFKNKTIDLSDKNYYGTRDRSWGVRPVGQPDTQMLVPVQMPQFYWLWVPANFEDFSTHVYFVDDEEGYSKSCHSVIQEDAEKSEETLINVTKKLSYSKGTRRISNLTINSQRKDGSEISLNITPKYHIFMCGLGYMHPEWGHGFFKGENESHYDSYNLNEDPHDPPFLHIQAISEFVITEKGKSLSGIGVIEQLFVGPHKISGLNGLFDGAI
tara:strand:- start:3465 stop:4565 length:1101 start_codon:yes stop_codon:yes gene_type:complete